MKPVLIKIFNKGEYYQTYSMKLKVIFDENKKQWLYETFMKKNEKDKWIKCNCIEEKIVPIVKLMISDILKDLLVKDIVKCYF